MWPRWTTGHADLADLALGQRRGRGRSRSGWAGRRRSTGRSAPWPGWCGTARCWPWPSSAPSRCGSSTGDPAAPGARGHAAMISPPAARGQTTRPSRPDRWQRQRRPPAGEQLEVAPPAAPRRRRGVARWSVAHCTSSSRRRSPPSPQQLDERDQRHLRRVGAAVEHRLAGEQAADGHAVEPAGQPVVVPGLDAVGPARARAGARRRPRIVGGDPAAGPVGVGARRRPPRANAVSTRTS